MTAGDLPFRLVMSNRPENLELLRDFVGHWSESRGLSPRRRECLEQAAAGIFQHLVGETYGPERHGAISVSLEDQGPRVRLVFEDDAPPFSHAGFNSLPGTTPSSDAPPTLTAVCPLADSLIYYRTEDHKNRFVLTVAR